MKLMHLDEMGRKCDYADYYTQYLDLNEHQVN